jgi:predicted DNA binding CopG/RHH family protein
MKKEYDFSRSVKNPYAKRLKRQLTLKVDDDVIAYFKQTAQETGIPLQTLINLYLHECVVQKKRLTFA